MSEPGTIHGEDGGHDEADLEHIAEVVEQQEHRTERIERRLETLEAQEREVTRLREALAYTEWREQQRLASRPYRVYDAMAAAARAPKDLAAAFRDAVVPSARGRSARLPTVVVVLAGLPAVEAAEVVEAVTVATYTRRRCVPVFVLDESARESFADALIAMGARFEFVRTQVAIDVARYVDERDPAAVVWPVGDSSASEIDRVVDEVLRARSRRRS